MAGNAREHWNLRYREGWRTDPAPFLRSLDGMLPREGKALDVAGGNGRNAVWLARRGLDVTVVDVSDEALAHAAAAARSAGVTLTLVEQDLTEEPLPVGPWDLILDFHFLQRDLFPIMIDALAPGGLLVGEIATVRNLERHPRPPEPYVLRAGELEVLLDGLEVVHHEEGWFDDHHQARFVARRHA